MHNGVGEPSGRSRPGGLSYAGGASAEIRAVQRQAGSGQATRQTGGRSPAERLSVSIGQHTDKGRKDVNQDFHGALVPESPTLETKGIAIALADGISSSGVSRIAAESAVKSFLTDYYCTSDAWTVKTSAHRVIAATNAWLNAQSRRGPGAFDRDQGYVCTFTVVVLKGAAAHIFHVGDARVYRVSGSALEQLTEDHRVVVSSVENYLGRALGAKAQVEIDYRKIAVAPGDVLLLATDGVYEHVEPKFVTRTVAAHGDDLDGAARAIVAEAMARGSTDNLTIQIVRVDTVAQPEADEVLDRAADLPLPPLLEPRMMFDGFRVVRQLHASSRSHIYLAIDEESGQKVVLKIPSIDQRGDPAYLKRFMMEEWVARRIDSVHVLKGAPVARKQNFLYVATEYIEGQTLAQWMIDNPRPSLEAVRDIVSQIALALRAFHRREMLHQDLRPANIMIDVNGTVKLIDFGSVRVAGVAETRVRPDGEGEAILGTAQYTAPEYFLGDDASTRSDLFSLGVIAYQMLTGALPYGTGIARARTRRQMMALPYTPAATVNPAVPPWMDGALARAVHLDPNKRTEVLSELVHDLRHPNARYLDNRPKPLMERDPLVAWKVLSLLLFVTNVVLLYRLTH